MELFQIIILAVIQGLTEFLPISSSAHLILPKELLGWSDQGLAFDVAVHVGSLLAVMLYFRQEIHSMTVAWLTQVTGGDSTPDSRLAWAVFFGTIPVGIVGFLLDDFIESNLRSLVVIGTTTIIFGLLLWYSEYKGSLQRDLDTLGVREVLFIGCAQVLALMPGTSRSGITMTAALLMGYKREAAARYSFLLSIPLIIVGGLFKAIELSQAASTPWLDIGIATLISAITAYLCIHWFLRLLDKIGFMPFVIYRLILGVIIFMVIGLS